MSEATEAPKPNPGSKEAIKAGCICPVLDNAQGKGTLAWGGMTESPNFWITAGCPLHYPITKAKP